MATLLAWYNILFLVSIATGIVMVVGVLFSADADSDHDMDHDLDFDAHHDFGDTDHDLDADHDAEAKGSVLDRSAHHGRSLFMRTLAVIGVGKVPLSLLLMLIFLTFGISGYVSNTVLQNYLAPQIYFWISLAVAIVCMLFFTGRLAKLLNKYVPSYETYVLKNSDLIGSRGKIVISANKEMGIAHVYDKNSDLHRIKCKTAGEEISEGQEILVTDYDKNDNSYIVNVYNLREELELPEKLQN